MPGDAPARLGSASRPAPVFVSYDMRLTPGWTVLQTQGEEPTASSAIRTEARLVNATLGRSGRQGTTSSAYFSEVRDGDLVSATLAIVVRQLGEDRITVQSLLHLLQAENVECVTDQVSLPASGAVRLVAQSMAIRNAEGKDENVLKCQYWLPAPNGDAAVVVDFATHVNRHVELMALQFEEMANSFRFLEG